MKISELTSSRYLKQEDVEEPKLWTIREVQKENIAPKDKDPEYAGVMYFDEVAKGMVVKSTNLQLASIALKSGDTDDWIGKKIVVYVDPTVSYAGKVTGGIRLRAPKP